MALGYKLDRTGTAELRRIGEFKDKRSVLDMRGHRHLSGKDVEPFRRKIFERSGGKCEMDLHVTDCPRTITWETFELHHDPSGYERSDSMESAFAISRQCHRGAHVRVKLRTIPL